jgi:hypothetical protein
MEERGATKEKEIKKERNAVLYCSTYHDGISRLDRKQNPLSISDMNPFHCAPKK